MASSTPRRSERNRRAAMDHDPYPGFNNASRRTPQSDESQSTTSSSRQEHSPESIIEEQKGRPKEKQHESGMRKDVHTGPGMADYSMSFAFRSRPGTQSALAHHNPSAVTAIPSPEVAKDVRMKGSAKEASKSVVMIFSKENVRRASHFRKRDFRMQKRNRRMCVSRSYS
ncbi:hypothetical protein J1614_001401 [Plenodomus biglobosus]|nr:hypothetical protein J1614_001401 [Plenodomus biglobosus]